jgi:hypothetical protein
LIETGTFRVNGTWGNAAIGSGYAKDATSRFGNLTVVNGTFNVSGSYGGGGFGSGLAHDDGVSTAGFFTFEAGTVYAWASYAAVIGTGWAYGESEPTKRGHSRVRGITINSGTYVLVGRDRACGIGSGPSLRGVSAVDDIDIREATIIAIGTRGAAIGTVSSERGNTTIGRIAISSSRVTAISLVSGGAAIGAGRGEIQSTTRVESIEIDSSSIFAVADYGAGIGSGASFIDTTSTECGSIRITNSELNVSTSYGAAIGSGSAQQGASIVHSIFVQDSLVHARSRLRGSGIGCGAATSGSVAVGSVAIIGGICTTESEGGSGIGGGFADMATGFAELGQLSIEDALVHARGTYGAGLGAGQSGTNAVSRVRNMAIVNSTVDARATYAAAIGSGYADGGESSVMNLSIENGSVNASGEFGAGIGAGAAEDQGNSTVAAARITGAIIWARGLEGAAGIGAGTGRLNGVSRVGLISIEGGFCNATGDTDGAGIGAGEGSTGNSIVDEVSLVDGSFVLSGGFGAGLGAGWADYYGESRVAEITVLAGNLEISSIGGSGIGGGTSYSGFSSIGKITLAGGVFRVQGSPDVPGIGSGFANMGNSTIDELIITGGTYYVQAGVAAPAIGAAMCDGSVVVNLTVAGGSITTIGDIGIGALRLGVVERLTFTGAVSFDCNATEEGHCIKANHLAGDSVRLEAVVNTPVLVGVPFEGSDAELTIRYSVASEQEDVRFRAIQIGYLDETAAGTFVLTGQGFEKRIDMNLSQTRGILVTVPSSGHYSLYFDEYDKEQVALCQDDKEGVDVVDGNLYIESMRLCPSSNRLSVGEIVAVAVGGTLFVVGAVVITVCLCRREKGKRFHFIDTRFASDATIVTDPVFLRT